MKTENNTIHSLLCLILLAFKTTCSATPTAIQLSVRRGTINLISVVKSCIYDFISSRK